MTETQRDTETQTDRKRDRDRQTDRQRVGKWRGWQLMTKGDNDATPHE